MQAMAAIGAGGPVSTRRTPTGQREAGSGWTLGEAAWAMLTVSYTVFLLAGPAPFKFLPTIPVPAYEKLVIFAMLGLALVVIVSRWRLALRLFWQTSLFWLVIGVCVASVLWSNDPAATVRRASFALIAAITAFGVAVGYERLNTFLTMVLIGCAVVVFANVSTLALAPGIAIEDIGVRGAHSSKNIAGLVMMLIVLFTFGFLLHQKRTRPFLLAAAMLLVAIGFLALTRSKTSAALTLLAIGLTTPYLAVWRAHRPAGVLATMLAVLGVSTLFLAVAIADWSRADVLEALVGDPTFSRRTEIWDFVARDIAARPWLGFGYGGYWDVSPGVDPLERLPRSNWMRYVQGGGLNQAHNGYLDLQLQIGLPAMLLAVFAYLRVMFLAFRNATDRTTPGTERALFWIAFATIASFLLHNMMEASLFGRVIAIGNYALMLAFVATRVAGERRREALTTARAARGAVKGGLAR